GDSHPLISEELLFTPTNEAGAPNGALRLHGGIAASSAVDPSTNGDVTSPHPIASPAEISNPKHLALESRASQPNANRIVIPPSREDDPALLRSTSPHLGVVKFRVAARPPN